MASIGHDTSSATNVACSQLSDDAHNDTGEDPSVPPSNPEKAGDNAAGGPKEQSEEESDKFYKEMEECHQYIGEKSQGSLLLGLSGPFSHSSHITAYVSWDGRQTSNSWSHWDDRDKGIVKSSHASFDLYYRKRFVRKTTSEYGSSYAAEEYILFDVESQPKYENVHPGTVTVEGFGMEAWEYEDFFGKKRENEVFVSYAKLPNVSASKLLRRIDELRRGGNQKFGWAPEQEEADLKEFFGDMGVTYYVKPNARHHISTMFSLLNRTDIFTDFTTDSSIAAQGWQSKGDGTIGTWNFLWQIILAKELQLRIKDEKDTFMSGHSPRVLASLMVQDLWLRNVEIVLENAKVDVSGVVTPTPEEKEKAAKSKHKGNEALKNKKWQEAIDLYTEAIKIDCKNAIYYSNRSAALASLGKYEEANHDALMSTMLDPNYSKAWARLGMGELKRGASKRAEAAYERAIDLAGKDASKTMRQGLADAKARTEADFKAIKDEKNKDAQDGLRKAFIGQGWDIFGKTVEFHSHVHEQQVEGLLLFAERIKWPYINEARDFAECAYGNLRAGGAVSIHLYDWLFGMTLPGKFMSFKIMSALILCTPSISNDLGVAAYYECGLSLPRKSYWRVRTVLGRVLGCLPGVISLCGWIGPCPPVEFDPPLSSEATRIPRHIRLKARRVSPVEYVPDPEYDNIMVGRDRYEPYGATSLHPGEEIPNYIAEMKDDGKWAIPKPPVREQSTVIVKAIKLRKLPLDIHTASKLANKTITEKEADDQLEYRASIVFSFDNSEQPITYTLYTNPVFVTPPPCQAGPKGPHEAHARGIPRYQRNIWTVDRLKDHTPEDASDDVMVINATGKGTEVLARAWCSERGKNAIIRRMDGPCYACAVSAASKAHLGTGVLIWVS